MIKRAILVVVSGAVLMILFSVLIYPTTYRYLNYGTGSGYSMPVRVSVLTGKTEVFTANKGWTEVINSK